MKLYSIIVEFMGGSMVFQNQADNEIDSIKNFLNDIDDEFIKFLNSTLGINAIEDNDKKELVIDSLEVTGISGVNYVYYTQAYYKDNIISFHIVDTFSG